MTQKENPSTGPQEQRDALSKYPFMVDAEAVRKALRVEENAEEWRNFLRAIVEIKQPQEGKYALADTYIELDDRRVKIAQALNLLMGFLQKKESPPEDLISALRRNLPKYFVDQSLYHQRIRGIGDPRMPTIPKDLAEYVPLGEEEKTARLYANIILPTQYDVRDKAGIPATESPQILSLFINEVVLHAIIRRTRMGDVIAYLDAPAGTKNRQLQVLQKAIGFSSWTKQGEYSAMLLAQYLGKHREETQRYSTEVLGKPFAELTVAEALNATLHMSAAGELALKLSKNAVEIAKGNFTVVSNSIRESITEGRTYAEEALQTALAPIAELREDASDLERDAFRKDVREVIAFFLMDPKSTGSVRYLETYIADLKGPQQKYARTIIEKIVGTDAKERTIARLEQSLLLPKEKGGDAEAQRISTVVREMITEDKITLRDAFQLYYFSQVSKGGQIPLAFITLHLMDERAQQWMTATDTEARLFRTYVDLARKSENIEDLQNTLEEMGLPDISADTVEIRNLAQFLGERGLGEFSRWSYRFYAHIRKFPEFYIVTGAVTGTSLAVGGGLLARKAYIAVSLSKFSEIADMTDDALIQKFGRDTEAFRRAKLCRNEALALKTRYEISQLRFPRLREIQTPEAMKNWVLSRAQRRKTGRLLAQAAETADAKDLGEIFTILKREHSNIHVLMDLAEELGEDLPDIRKALQEAGFASPEITDAVKTRGTERFTARAQEIMEKIKRMEGIVDEPAKRKRALALIEEFADTFRDEFNAFADEFPDARRAVAKNLAGPGSEISEAFFEALEKAHVQKRLSQKVGIFFDAPINNEERKLAGRFIRLGLAGESEILKVPRTISQLRDGIRAAANGDEAMSLIRRFAHSTDALDPDAFRALLREKEIQTIVGTNEAIKVERAVNRATTQLTQAKLWRGAGIIAGAGLFAFGTFVDGYLMYETSKEITEAEKRGDSASAELLRSKWRSQRGEAGFGVISGGLGMAGVLTGLPGWVALGGLMAKSYSSDKLYDYAEDLNKTELKEFLKKSPEELLALLHGKGNWPVLDKLDGRNTKEFRYGLALDAYILKTHILTITPLDERYRKEVIFELPAWQEKNPYDPEVMAAAEKVILEEKATKFKIHVAEFLRETGGFESPSPRRMELATAYANLKYLERRANDLGDPTILHDALYKFDGFIPVKGIATVEPGDLLDDVKEHRIARALDEEKAGSLFQKVSMLKTMVEDGDMPNEVARAEFLREFAASLLAYDGALFVKDMAGKPNTDRFLHDQTLNQILLYAVGPLFDQAIESPGAFAKEALALRDSIRAFLASGTPFTVDELDTGGTSFGPKIPKWQRTNRLGVMRG